MKRKIVQHGPSTLTISLPATWTKAHGLHRGSEINIEEADHGLYLTADSEVQYAERELDVRGRKRLTTRLIAAMYKRGYDEIVVRYADSDELEEIHRVIDMECIGFEIVEERQGIVRIKAVTEPSQEDFKTLFRRIFYFLLAAAEDGYEAAKNHDTKEYQKLILRDQSINKLTNFCRRIVNKRAQREWTVETALYHVIEQLEKIGDEYRDLNKCLLEHKEGPGDAFLKRYEQANKLLRAYEDLFFSFDIKKVDAFSGECMRCLESPIKDECDLRVRKIVKELSNLSGTTMVLYL